MNILVQKYGGSSLKDKKCLEIVCNKIIEKRKKGFDLVIIVSAQGKTTNELIKKAENYCNLNKKDLIQRDLDFLLSTGEMQTASLLSMMINSKGYKSVCLNGSQAGILTNSNFSNAQILDIIPDNIISNLNEEKIVIITGFQGIDKLGNITTLGRGGSDLTAVAIACSLKAKKCEIYSDIDGIFSADPKIISTAKLLNNISYDEMLEASSNGAKVLHNRSVSLAKKYNLKILSKNTFSESKGTEITNISEDQKVHFITKQSNLSKICLVGQMINTNSNVITLIYQIANNNNIKMYMVSINELAINIIIDSENEEKFMNLLHKNLIEKEE